MKWYEDKRAISLECRVWDDDRSAGEIGKLTNFIAEGDTVTFSVNIGLYYRNIELLKGKKTKYDGKGQPVPNGVNVRVWTGGLRDDIIKSAEKWYWGPDNLYVITHYQVMGNEENETSRIDIIGQNGGDGEIYHHNHKHGYGKSHGASPTYQSWKSMKNRCCNKNNKKYHRYGGRGIAVSSEWKNDFLIFLKDMGERPDGMSLDRIKNNGNYTKDNCKWSTPEEQANNTSKNVSITYGNETLHIEQWVRKSKIPRTTFYRRYYTQNKRGDELFKPTIHMVKESIYLQIIDWLAVPNKLNFTKMSVELNLSRKKLAKIYKEFL